MDGPRYMKRRVKSGDVTVDFDARSLIVEYEVEAAVLGDYGDVLRTETKSHRKVIRIKTLTEESDIGALAEEIVDRCSLIHESKLTLVIELLYALQERMAAESRSGRSKKDKEARRAARRKAKASKGAREAKEAEAASPAPPVVDASMDKLEEYMEKLYDESLDERTAGAVHILELSKDPRNLETIAQDESLMGALSRTTKDDYKKSTDLAIALMQIFFSFSQFSQLHPYLTTYRVGDLSLRILEFEHRRHEARMEDLKRLTELAEAQAAGDTEKEAALRRNSVRGLEEAKKRDEEEAKMGADGAGAGGGSDKKSRSKSDKKDKKSRVKPLPEGKVDLAKARHKTTALMKKQERLLYVCIHVLLNVAENVQIERKMTKRQIITFLVPLLERDNPELVMLVVTFLRKLSIFEENKNLMATAGVVPLLVRFVPMSLPDVLMHAVLRLMFNLSFDKELCQKMVEANVLPPLVSFLKKPIFRAVVLRLLYHISQDDGCKTMFTYTEAIPLVLKLIINFPQNFVAKELIALGINLTHSPRNAEVVADGDGLKLLVSRVLKTNDTLLMKVIRNVSIWSRRELETLPEGEEYGQKGLWAPFVRDLYRMARTEDPDLLVEVLGTLGNITIDDLPRTATFPALIEDNKLVQHIQRQLLPGVAEDDIVLEIVMLIGTWCADPRVPPLLAAGGCRIARFMGDLLSEKADDPELCLQALFTLYRMMQTRDQSALEEVVYGTEAVPRMCDMMSHKHAEVVKYARLCLEIAIDYDKYDGHRGLWREVQLRRYQLYNREYVHYMASEDGEDSGLEDSKWEEALQRAQRALPDHEDEDDPGSPSTSYDGTAAWSPGSPLNLGRHHHVAVDFEALGYSADGTPFDHSPRTSPRAGAGAGGRPGAGDDEWWD